MQSCKFWIKWMNAWTGDRSKVCVCVCSQQLIINNSKLMWSICVCKLIWARKTWHGKTRNANKHRQFCAKRNTIGNLHWFLGNEIFINHRHRWWLCFDWVFEWFRYRLEKINLTPLRRLCISVVYGFTALDYHSHSYTPITYTILQTIIWNSKHR